MLIRAERCGSANVAQLVEQLTRNEQVSGSSPLVGSRNFKAETPVSAFSLSDKHYQGSRRLGQNVLLD